MKKITLLGSTGSIGTNTLDVIRNNPNLYEVIALVAGNNVDLMFMQCVEFKPRYVAMDNETSAESLRKQLKECNINIEVFSGVNAACELASLNEINQVMSAIVGISGLLPTLSAIRSSKTVLLANKESLITCGRFFMEEVYKNKAIILPVDSEHNAIFQNLPINVQQQLGYANLHDNGIKSIILTASGGPFYNIELSKLSTMSPNNACAHPNWSMGKKISVDSATMINKGFEYIEAHWLFNANLKQIEIVLHPQSIIHSMVRYYDGSVLAHLGYPDMRIPITYCMSWPKRINSTNETFLDFSLIPELTFSVPDFNRYPCLKLAIDACKDGQVATIKLNAANEIAVTAFLKHQINFTDIALLNYEVLATEIYQKEPNTIDAIFAIDHIARSIAIEMLPRISSLK